MSNITALGPCQRGLTGATACDWEPRLPWKPSDLKVLRWTCLRVTSTNARVWVTHFWVCSRTVSEAAHCTPKSACKARSGCCMRAVHAMHVGSPALPDASMPAAWPDAAALPWVDGLLSLVTNSSMLILTRTHRLKGGLPGRCHPTSAQHHCLSRPAYGRKISVPPFHCHVTPCNTWARTRNPGQQHTCCSAAGFLGTSQWGIWALLAACGAMGQVPNLFGSASCVASAGPEACLACKASQACWRCARNHTLQGLQDHTPAGRLFSAPLLALLLGLGAAWTGMMPTSSPAYDIIWSHAIPLATALYLLEADLRGCLPFLTAFSQTPGSLVAVSAGCVYMLADRPCSDRLLRCRIVRSTGTVFVAFCIATVATVIGTLAAWACVGSQLGPEGWKVRAAASCRGQLMCGLHGEGAWQCLV